MKGKQLMAMVLAVLAVFTGLTPTVASANNEKVQYLVDKGWVEGRGGGDLALDSKITRAEFTKMIVVIEGLDKEARNLKNQTSKFIDLDKDHWANGYINLAMDKGYINGYPDGTFRPGGMITYEEILTILARLHPLFKFRSDFRDQHWASQYISFAKSIGFLKGLDLDDRDLKKDALREETFSIIYNYIHSPRSDKDNPNGDQPLYDFLAKEGSKAPEQLDEIIENIELARVSVEVIKLNPSQENIRTVRKLIADTRADIEKVPNEFYIGDDFLDKIQRDLYEDLNEIESELNNI